MNYQKIYEVFWIATGRNRKWTCLHLTTVLAIFTAISRLICTLSELKLKHFISERIFIMASFKSNHLTLRFRKAQHGILWV